MDYAARLSKVKEKIRAKGRQITLSSLDPDSADANKPWLPTNNPRNQWKTDYVSVYAVNVPISSAGSLGMRSEAIELYGEAKSVYIVEPGDINPEGLDQYQLVTDGGQEFKITFIEKLKPADLTLLYYIGVNS